MKALSIKQPWAHRIVYGDKRVENRTWGAGYRGDFLIHASKVWDQGVEAPDVNPDSVAYGAIIGVAFLDSCILIDDVNYWIRQRPELSWLASHRWKVGPFMFVLDDVRAFAEPIPYKGALQFFEVDDDVVAEQLKAATLMKSWHEI